MLWQAQAEFPGTVFASLGGGVIHAIRERLETPATFCTAGCGRMGFADDTMMEDGPVCMRCVERLLKA